MNPHGSAFPGLFLLPWPSGCGPDWRVPPAFSVPFRVSSRRCQLAPLDVSASPGIRHRLAHEFRWSPHNPEGSHTSVMVRVQGFSPSSRFSPPLAVRVCFTPLTPFGFSLQGVPLPRSCIDSSPTPCRRAVFPAVAHPFPRSTGPRAHRPVRLDAQARCLWPASRP